MLLELEGAMRMARQRVRSVINERRGILGERVVQMLVERVMVLRLRREADFRQGRDRRDAVAAYDTYLRRSRFDSFQAIDHALGVRRIEVIANLIPK